MDLSAIEAVVSGLNTAVSLTRAIGDLATTTEVNATVAELHEAHLAALLSATAAVQAQMALHEEVRDLKEQLRELQDWGEQEHRYVLVDPWRSGAQAYALREEFAEGESPHYLCGNCFHAKKRRFLQPVKLSSNQGGWVQAVCGECNSKMDTGIRVSISAPKYAEALTG